MEEIKNNITIVINALNNVETKGFQNLSNLSGCISILQKILETMNQPPEEE